jgi:predicted RNase H-like HicB family nuclease
MQYLVLLQPHNGGYRAAVPGLPGCQSDGATEEEALTNIRHAISETLRRTKVVTVEVPEPMPLDPWTKIIGMYGDDAEFEEFQHELQAYRRELDKP